MKKMTLCYMQKDNQILMLHRTKKEIDINKSKWIGVGGKIEKNEKPIDGMIREIKEETGYTAISCDFRGFIHFFYNDHSEELIYLYTCNNFHGILQECLEGELHWIDKDNIFTLNLWEGDKIFLNLLAEDSKIFDLYLYYHNDDLLKYELKFL
ncbi:NUDIX hydrolase [Peptostreptococcus equinus]|uniref:8-oxo-dGTP diphosphatase n=1 Tax=Peptostreptococcus equinus TaxID=3003601 RepID=A0ABY7JPQ6_9FIRM|nr:8-oxo-dGTP diphosphatase [Peptostreptococcus sp. CBA3647]WAW14474.1 8-oxo-dGTP diphosphatase [Peptostreptococcus sp. CBA3647]